MGRGQVDQRVKDASLKFLGEELSQEEMRLIPYIQYVMVNEQKLDPNHISASERIILRKWKDKKYIEGGASGLVITREFWDFICEVLFYSYVDYNNQGEL